MFSIVGGSDYMCLKFTFVIFRSEQSLSFLFMYLKLFTWFNCVQVDEKNMFKS